MREALAGVLAGYQGLGGDDTRERPVDRLGALGLGAANKRQVELMANEALKGKQADREAALRVIGSCLIRFRDANCSSSRKDAEDLLALALAWPARRGAAPLNLKRRERDKVARQAIREWALDFCPVCKGVAEIPRFAEVEGSQPMSACPPDPVGCGGTGRRRYSDAERAEAMGQPYSEAMQEAHGLISLAHSIAIRVAKEMLERW